MSVAPKTISKRHVVAVAVGNALEFYDFLTYSFFAIYIGKVFFPAENASLSLILSLATFGAGFISRPMGGWLLGRMGDKIGRRPAMMLSFIMMGGSILVLALTPSYAAIGVAAPIIVVLCRLIQGFALGGEVGPSTAFLLEAAPPERRAFFVSMQFTSQNVAVLAAGTVGVVLSSTLDADALESWGWRAAMLLGTLVIPLGIILRNSLPETLHQTPPIVSAPSAGARPIPMRIIVLGMFLLSTGTIGTYTINYLSTYAIATLGLPAQIAFGATMITGLAATVFNPVMGLLADRFGRRPVMLIAGLSRALVILPGFYWIGVDKSVAVFYLVAFILITAQTFTIGPSLVWLSESIPAHIRSSSVGTIYAVAISVFGGTTQVIAASLTSWLNDPMAPAYYWVAAAIIGAVAIYFTDETAPNLVRESKSKPLAQALDGI